MEEMRANLELHGMRLLALGQGELGAKVLLDSGIQALEDRVIDGLLQSLALSRDLNSGLLGVEKLALSGRGLGGSGALEERVVHGLRHGNTVNVHLGGGGDDVSLVHAAQWHAVDLVRAWERAQHGHVRTYASDHQVKNNRTTTGDTGELN